MWKFAAALIIVLMTMSTSPTRAQNLLNTLQGVIGGTLSSSGTSTSDDDGSALSTSDITAGLREALRVGTERVVGQIGSANGFNSDPNIHIPLPPALQDVQSTLKQFGLSSLADDVEIKLNRAAEKAVPQTKELIWNAITNMTLEDAQKIFNGPDDAATQYFKRIASSDLAHVIEPIVDQTLSEVGAIASYDDLIGQYSAIPFVPDLKADLTDHTVQMALQGLFHYLAKEEAGIRQNPAKQTTDLLARVFGP